jgi:hypothetical protein
MDTNPNKQYPNNRNRFPQAFRDISFSKEPLGFFLCNLQYTDISENSSLLVTTN